VIILARWATVVALAGTAGFAMAQSFVVSPELWDRPRTGRAVLEQPAIREAVKAHLGRQGSHLVVHHDPTQEALLLAEELRAWGHDTALVADEGGLAAPLATNRDAIEVVLRGIDRAGLITGKEAALALDVAATQLLAADGRYHLRSESRVVTATELVDEIVEWCEAYPIVSVEDPLAEDDPLWVEATKALAGRQVLGDDLFVTNVEYIARGIRENSANAALIKLNQIGSVTETIEAVKMCQRAGWGACVSHRSGETVDSFIADMTVALDTGHLKTGAPARGERVEKYNQLLRIEEDLGTAAQYAGKEAFIRPVRF